MDPGEFDGLLRLCFTRKNRTLSAALKCSNAVELMTTASEAVNPNLTVSISDAVDAVLEEYNLREGRGIRLSGDQYLELLVAFNKRGIRFPRIGRNAAE